jgi:hypothetical protein
VRKLLQVDRPGGWWMMARMLSQLPLLPAGAAEIAPGVGMLEIRGGRAVLPDV